MRLNRGGSTSFQVERKNELNSGCVTCNGDFMFYIYTTERLLQAEEDYEVVISFAFLRERENMSVSIQFTADQ